jgi:hypothetical protein
MELFSAPGIMGGYFMMTDEDTSTASQVRRGSNGMGSVRVYLKNREVGRRAVSSGNLRQSFTAKKKRC